ncbi:MBOAT (membrane bound O-acyl transferase) family protein [Actinidia rufa]|uniref:MBOAT (Membrane bound O-acyl transferase) family protein n=1 Tax=Actinidia rufa TaxID=165716 RepID=A0A7J0DEK9_9ERIC|nr:MBOAT (membrane bound O-acyl transferase) family protein [Actinidia rufa]
MEPMATAIPPLFRGHPAGEPPLPPSPRRRSAQAPLRRRIRRLPFLPLLRRLLQPPLPRPHAPRPTPPWLSIVADAVSSPSSSDSLTSLAGALMVLVLKVISCAMNYDDGLLKEEDLREAQKRNRLLKLPRLLNMLATASAVIWARSVKGWPPSSFGATIRAIVQAAFCMGLYLYLVPQHPLSQFTEPVYHEWGFWSRLGYPYMSGLTACWKYYFVWSISEAAVIISGLCFSGWKDSSPPKPRWDGAKNVDILGVEFAKTAAQIPLAWNIQGLYPGYIIFFVQSALMIAVIYRWQQAVPSNMDPVKKILVFLNFACTVLMFYDFYACISRVLSLQETLVGYGSVYYIGTIVPIVFILLGHVIKLARPSRSKAQKQKEQ